MRKTLSLVACLSGSAKFGMLDHAPVFEAITFRGSWDTILSWFSVYFLAPLLIIFIACSFYIQLLHVAIPQSSFQDLSSNSKLSLGSATQAYYGFCHGISILRPVSGAPDSHSQLLIDLTSVHRPLTISVSQTEVIIFPTKLASLLRLLLKKKKKRQRGVLSTA